MSRRRPNAPAVVVALMGLASACGPPTPPAPASVAVSTETRVDEFAVQARFELRTEVAPSRRLFLRAGRLESGDVWVAGPYRSDPPAVSLAVLTDSLVPRWSTVLEGRLGGRPIDFPDGRVRVALAEKRWQDGRLVEPGHVVTLRRGVEVAREERDHATSETFVEGVPHWCSFVPGGLLVVQGSVLSGPGLSHPLPEGHACYGTSPGGSGRLLLRLYSGIASWDTSRAEVRWLNEVGQSVLAGPYLAPGDRIRFVTGDRLIHTVSATDGAEVMAAFPIPDRAEAFLVAPDGTVVSRASELELELGARLCTEDPRLQIPAIIDVWLGDDSALVRCPEQPTVFRVSLSSERAISLVDMLPP